MLARLLILLLMWLCVSQSPVVANEILVITGQGTLLKEMSIKKLKNIFLRKTLISDSGIHWIPVNLSSEHPVRQAFSQSLFNQQPEDMEFYWNAQYFQGVSPPYAVASEQAMLLFIANTPGAIGYILPCHLDARVQVIFKLKTSVALEKNCNSPSTH